MILLIAVIVFVALGEMYESKKERRELSDDELEEWGLGYHEDTGEYYAPASRCTGNRSSCPCMACRCGRLTGVWDS